MKIEDKYQFVKQATDELKNSLAKLWVFEQLVSGQLTMQEHSGIYERVHELFDLDPGQASSVVEDAFRDARMIADRLNR